MAKAKVDKKFLATMLGMAGLGALAFGHGAYKRFGQFNKETAPQAQVQQQRTQQAQRPQIKPKAAPVVAAPQKPVAASPQSQAYEFSHPTIEKFLGGIAKAEHRALGDIDHKQYDPRLMIRTGGGDGSSSAYGPYQITRNLARGLVKNHPTLFAPIKDFANDFVAQGSQFLKAQNKDKVHGLKGKGTLYGPEYHDDHMRLGDLAIQGLAKEKKINYKDGLTPRELDTMVQTWRGVSEREDPEYYKIVRSHYFSE
jgi:hypothetical protein